MIGRQLTSLATALLISLPHVALAGDADVRVGNVRINTNESGGVSVDTGRNGVNINSDSNIRANRWQKKRYCIKRRSSGRVRCYYKRIYRDSTKLDPLTYDRFSSKVRTNSSHTCAGNSTYSSQEITQSNNDSKVYIESSISTSGCN